ncbi:hypothetical protein [Bacillus cereus group sp. BfR-BA-01446]|nr:hypothetical protein [Bacillus cereus group sp. BfR-BA-01446]
MSTQKLVNLRIAFAAILFGMLVYWKLPPWIIVVAGAVGGTLISLL